MGYYVYILYSPSLNKFYKGQSSNVLKRLGYHNAGYESYSKRGVPWMLLWYKEVSDKSEANKLERHLKNLTQVRILQFLNKYGAFIQDLILFEEIKQKFGSSH